MRRYRDKFGIPFPLLLAGINDMQVAAASLPQLQGFTAFPTTMFLGRDGRVKLVHAGFLGPATGSSSNIRYGSSSRRSRETIEGLRDWGIGGLGD